MAPSGRQRRPRVLLADDHRQVVEAVSAMLAEEFDVVGVAADGHEALSLARHVRPDVIVLDVDMPRLDGFQTLRALRHAGPPETPAVFLSMNDSEEVVSEGFRCGGHGYVVKARAGRDLPTALHQAIAGRRFVPSLTSFFRLAPTGGHAMQLHRGPEPLVEGIAACVSVALRRGDAVCIIATGRVRRGLEDRLRSRGWDVGGPAGHPRYLVIDAAAALQRFMRNGRPDTAVLAEIATELDGFRRAVGEGPDPRLLIFGNMVALLCAEGNIDAVVALERTWNTLTSELPFFTLCGYPASCFHEGVPGLWACSNAEHHALSHASDV